MAVQETAAHGWRVLRDGAIAARETGTGQDPRYTASGITMSRESDTKAGATLHQKHGWDLYAGCMLRCEAGRPG